MTKIVGGPELIAKLKRIGNLDGLAPVIQSNADEVTGFMRTYPRATQANSPQQRRWYERGRARR